MTGFYVVLRLDNIAHIRFARDKQHAEEIWREMFRQTEREASIIDTSGTVHHDGPASERANA